MPRSSSPRRCGRIIRARNSSARSEPIKKGSVATAELSKRAFVAVIGGGLFLGAIYGPLWLFGILMLVLACVGMAESIRLGASLYGVIIVIGFLSAAGLRQHGVAPILAVTLATWATDVFAYLVGMKFGRRKLAPKISPKKTWEGSVGGLAGGLATGALLGFPIFGAVCGTIGQAGDLLESYYKRRAGVKDSGALFPGHGGVLDRFDAFVINALVCYVIINW